MSDKLYADTANVVAALQNARETAEFDDETRVSVYDSEAVMDGLTSDEVEARNLFGHLGEHICTFEYDGTRLTLSFHERQIDGTFTLRPAGADAIGADQATNPKELAPSVGEVLRSVERQWNIHSYDFTEVSAGSMATGGHFTDFEFEYVLTGF